MSTLHPSPQLDALLRSRKILITCGTGGVGKTTLSAALAARGALLGLRVAVITIDPAKRLAQSLGLQHLGNEPQDLNSELARASGHPVAGTLHALMPSSQETFEAFVREIAPDSAMAERVLHNPIFEVFSREFSGANEYMALERLYALHRDARFDLIILDTPPSRNMVHFLQAPELLGRFFEERLVRWLVLPTNRLLSVTMKKALGLLEKLTGEGFMTHLMEFASAMLAVQDRFVSNLRRIRELLRSPEVGFVLVAAPAPDLARELARFAALLQERSFRLEGILLNRSLSSLPASAAPSDPIDAQAFAVIEALRAREQAALATLGAIPVPQLARVPELARDVHSMEDLLHVAHAL